HRDLHSFPTRRSSDLNTNNQRVTQAKNDVFDCFRLLFSVKTDAAYGSSPPRSPPPSAPARSSRSHRPAHCFWAAGRCRPPVFCKDRKSTRLNSSHVKI